METWKDKRIVLLGLSVALLTALHFAVGTHSHSLHVIHVVLGGLYLLPIITAAVWFGLEGGLVLAGTVSLAYVVHIRWSWPNQPMENANQVAMIGVYLLVGGVSGVLVSLRDRERRQRQEAEQRAQREVVLQGFASLCNALEARDEGTLRHSEEVSRLAVEIGKRRGLQGEELEVLRLAGLVHDIGKIGVRDDVLLKAGQLTPDERARMQRHPTLAADILRPIQGAQAIADIVQAHHECPDGSGYPYALERDQIPIPALILSVADVYSALRTARSYKPALDSNTTMEIIGKMAVTSKLDAESVRILQEIIWEQARLEPDLSSPAPAVRRLSPNGHRHAKGLPLFA